MNSTTQIFFFSYIFGREKWNGLTGLKSARWRDWVSPGGSRGEASHLQSQKRSICKSFSDVCFPGSPVSSSPYQGSCDSSGSTWIIPHCSLFFSSSSSIDNICRFRGLGCELLWGTIILPATHLCRRLHVCFHLVVKLLKWVPFYRWENGRRRRLGDLPQASQLMTWMLELRSTFHSIWLLIFEFSFTDLDKWFCQYLGPRCQYSGKSDVPTWKEGMSNQCKNGRCKISKPGRNSQFMRPPHFISGCVCKVQARDCSLA